MSEKIERLLKLAVTGKFRCQKCGSIIATDCKVCGLCGWENPIADY